MERIKLLLLSSSLENSGPVNVLFNIVKYIDKERIDVTVLSLGHSNKNSRINDFKGLGVNVEEFEYKNIIQSFYRYCSFIRYNKFDIIHAHCLRSLLFVSIKNNGSLIFYTIHIYPGYQTMAIQGRLKGTLLNKISCYLLKKTDVNIACADSLRDQIISNLTSHCLSVPNGIEGRYKMLETEKDKLKLKLFLNRNMKYFIFVGRLSVEKRPMFLIENFLKSFSEEYGLIMLGDGPLLPQILSFNSERIHVLGFKNNVADYLFVSDYYISTSVVEGLANTFLEALSVGLPCFVSNIPSHKEVLYSSNRFIGVEFEMDNADDFKKKSSLFLKQVSKNTTVDVIRCFESKYTAKRMSGDYQKIYVNKYTEVK